MYDDVRKNHDPRPSEEERRWIAADFFKGLSRLALMAGLAAAIGLWASVLLERASVTSTVASAR